jgi:hypothetical protein
MRFIGLLFLLFTGLSQVLPAQAPAATDTSWRVKLATGLNFNQASFSGNWRAGGVNSVALGSLLNLKASYAKGRLDWVNELDLLYGLLNNRGQGFRKTTDRILLDTKAGYKLSGKWNMFVSANFLSQFAPGFQYEKDSLDREQARLISKFMSPGFLTFAYGFEYKPVDYFYLRLSPFSPRFTFVTDRNLYLTVPDNYGVPLGKTVRQEWLATQVLADFNRNVTKTLSLKARYQLFANLQTLAFNTLDHRLDVSFTSKVTDYINVNLTGILLYDRDQDADVQLSQSLAVGLAYTLNRYR